MQWFYFENLRWIDPNHSRLFAFFKTAKAIVKTKSLGSVKGSPLQDLCKWNLWEVFLDGVDLWENTELVIAGQAICTQDQAAVFLTQ